MTQNVCLDAGGKVLIDVSPVDGNPDCVRHRDLQADELLPYHKHDQPSPADASGAPLGYQRHDSFPVATASFGTVVEQSFDFGVGEGRRFGVFDRGSDGGDVAILSSGRVAMGATEDGGAGFQLFVGECQGKVSAAALADSWIVTEYETGRPVGGDTVARLNDLMTGHQELCPDHFNPAYTDWRIVPFRYRATPGQGQPITLTTLISEHYGGSNPATADHVERFYFTRELGGTRWERWQNANGNRQFSATQIAKRAEWFASTQRCSAAEPPAGGAPMVLIDCREWSRIVPPADAVGDRPGFFIHALRQRSDAPPFFAAPARD
jgi:hypothetical protein